MSAQIKAIEPSEITKMAVVSQPNIVSINGQKREVEQIRIEDMPKVLDKKIGREEEMFNNILLVHLAAATATVVGAVCFVCTSSPVAIGFMVAGTILYLGSAFYIELAKSGFSRINQVV